MYARHMYRRGTGLAGSAILMLLLLVASKQGPSKASTNSIPPGTGAEVVEATDRITPASRELAESEPPPIPADLQAEVREFTPPPVSLIDGDRVDAENTMAVTRFNLIETGDAFRAISRSLVNASLIRREINEHQTGYTLPVVRIENRFAFAGEILGWRSADLNGVSAWPSKNYPAARTETMNQVASLEPIPMQVRPEQDLALNLRLYRCPVRIGFEGSEYMTEDALFAFFVHPERGSRVAALRHGDKTFVAVDQPISAIMKLYVPATESYKGPLGLGKVHVPSKFYAESLEIDSAAVDTGPIAESMAKITESGRFDTVTLNLGEQLYIAIRHHVDDE